MNPDPADTPNAGQRQHLAVGGERPPGRVKSEEPVRVVRRPERVESDDKRVITRPFEHNFRRARSILSRALRLSDAEAAELLDLTRQKFSARHRNLDRVFLENFEAVSPFVDDPSEISETRRKLIGAYFTMEYSIESAAIFNPSLVPHPDQTGVPAGAVRVLMSLRAVGEGHLSSIVFRQAVVTREGAIHFDPPPEYASWARPAAWPEYNKRRFMRKLLRIQPHLSVLRKVFDRLPDPFTLAELDAAVTALQEGGAGTMYRPIAKEILWLANAHYTLQFPRQGRAEETVIFPATDHERRGMEDLRLVRFVDDDGQVRYHGTYTAYDGQRSLPMLMSTVDFNHFDIRPLGGRYVKDKGMALFPRKVNGQYLMISRHDGENLYLLRSEDLEFWDEGQQIQAPVEPWELVQIGNSGSPIETDAGWLLLTHGVGPVREYSLGAILLDRNDPSQVIGRLRKPLLAPTTEEREGYVPNVVYTCGALLHDDKLILPYAMS
ncbi:MAG: glycoside hydrolase family 130 protein, partial [Phycisphaeraceae bacterium]